LEEAFNDQGLDFQPGATAQAYMT